MMMPACASWLSAAPKDCRSSSRSACARFSRSSWPWSAATLSCCRYSSSLRSERDTAASAASACRAASRSRWAALSSWPSTSLACGTSRSPSGESCSRSSCSSDSHRAASAPPSVAASCRASRLASSMRAACAESSWQKSRRCAASAVCAGVGAGVDATARSRNDCALPSTAPLPGSAAKRVVGVAGGGGWPRRVVAGVSEPPRAPDRYRSKTARP